LLPPATASHDAVHVTRTRVTHTRTCEPSRLDHRAFTLVELLTVIAIIGILAAIIIPTAGKVRQSAQTAKCASTLRQIANASAIYLTENPKGYYLPNAWRNASNNQINWYSIEELHTILGRKTTGLTDPLPSQYMCPGAANATNNNIIKPGGYASNYYGLSVVPGTDGGWTPKKNVAFASRAAAATALVTPSRVIQFADGQNWQMGYTETLACGNADATTASGTEGTNVMAFRHNGKANIAFYDGHVETRDYNYIMEEKPELWRLDGAKP
jgi:prepilin-type processing-associated H-X9-DG protein/prepilin-type N-terminal cleavage/methylation domain-containing protein